MRANRRATTAGGDSGLGGKLQRQRPGRLVSLFLFWWVVFVVVAGAQTPQSAFDNANKLYEQGKFAEAASAFESLAKSGRVSEAVYFNWGNALFKAGKLGQAIAAYEHAQRLSPRDPDVLANLQFARNHVQAPTLPPDRVARWLGKLSLNEWTCLAAGAVWVWFGILTLSQWRPALKPVLGTWFLWLSLVTVALCAGFAAAVYKARGVEHAIVVTADAVARRAPLDESERAFVLHDGAELEVLDRKEQWLQVQAGPRQIGWLAQDSVLVLRLH